MLWHFGQADAEYGRRVAEGLSRAVPSTPPAPLRERLRPEDVAAATGGPDPKGDSITSPRATGEQPPGKP